jgi:hypothetical protein
MQTIYPWSVKTDTLGQSSIGWHSLHKNRLDANKKKVQK